MSNKYYYQSFAILPGSNGVSYRCSILEIASVLGCAVDSMDDFGYYITNDNQIYYWTKLERDRDYDVGIRT